MLSAWIRDIMGDSEDMEMGEYVSEEEEKEEQRESASSRVSLSALLNP